MVIQLGLFRQLYPHMVGLVGEVEGEDAEADFVSQRAFGVVVLEPVPADRALPMMQWKFGPLITPRAISNTSFSSSMQ